MADLTEEVLQARYRRYIKPGTRWLGIVTSRSNFGAFIELPGYIMALVHIAELSDTPINNVEEAVAVGQFVTVGLKMPGDMIGPLVSLRKGVGTGEVQSSPVPFQAAWRTNDTLGIARRMQYDAYTDPRLVPILADALEEAGCDDADLLELCRAANVPTQRPGWWIAETLLRS